MTFCFLGKCQTNPNPHYAFSGRRFRRLHHASAQKQIRRRNRRTRRTTTKEKNVQEQRERREEYQKTRERRRQRKHHLYEIHPRVRRDRVRLLRFYLPERGEKEETGGRAGAQSIALETDVNHGTRRLPNGLSLRLQERYQRRLERRSVIQTTLLLRPKQVRIRKRSRSSDIRRKRGKRDRQCSDSD